MRDATEILIVLDKSGSMNRIRESTIGGFNNFLVSQKELPGEANLTLIQFNDEYQVMYDSVPIKAVPPLVPSTYMPNGSTALLDALAKGIITKGQILEALPEEKRPNKVICVVITDGQENSSVEFSVDKVREMVKHQEEKYNWAFIFLGANMNSFAEARKVGIRREFAVDFAPTPRGAQGMSVGYDVAVSSYRRGGKKELERSGWKDKVKE